MSIFRKKKKEETMRPGQERIARGIASRILRLQAGWAGWMQRRSERLSKRGKTAALVGCTIVGAALSTVYVVAAIKGNGSPVFGSKSMVSHSSVHAISRPKPVEAGLEVARIRHFRRYIDSLSKSASGRRVADSLLHNRPHLMDSLRQVEQLYR